MRIKDLRQVATTNAHQSVLDGLHQHGWDDLPDTMMHDWTVWVSPYYADIQRCQRAAERLTPCCSYYEESPDDTLYRNPPAWLHQLVLCVEFEFIEHGSAIEIDAANVALLDYRDGTVQDLIKKLTSIPGWPTSYCAYLVDHMEEQC